MPSTSLALRPASRMALRTASTAIARVERLEPREYSVSPTPTMQYLSFRLMGSFSSPARLRSIPRARIGGAMSSGALGDASDPPNGGGGGGRLPGGEHQPERHDVAAGREHEGAVIGAGDV